MSIDSPPIDRAMSQSVYMTGRSIVVLAAWALLISAFGDEAGSAAIAWTVGGIIIATATTAGLQLMSSIRGITYVELVRWTALLDLISLGLLIIGLREMPDPVYPALLGLTVFYSYLVPRREMWILPVASAAAYLVAHLVSGSMNEWAGAAIMFLKAAAIAFVGVMAAHVSARHDQYRRQIELSNARNEELNERLSRRVSELQAVSQITEVIHSSLDFDRAGPLMLQILQKVIDIPSCCLIVIDKQKAETLFSASIGPSGRSMLDSPRADRILAGPDEFDFGDSHFTCMSVLDHKHMMVVFCAEPERIDQLTAEDSMVLHAVSSELVVAVENSQLYKLTRRLAMTDDLTGLYNYRHLQQRLDEEIERARRYHKDVSLIMIDVDDFKNFNDTRGHLAGDRALFDLGSVIKRSIREVDMAARYGGEEFAVVLPETDAAGAFIVAEKIRESVAKYEFADADGTPGPHLTVSLGLASYPIHADGKETLLRQADDALYKAKSGEKNRVRSPKPYQPQGIDQTGALDPTGSDPWKESR